MRHGGFNVAADDDEENAVIASSATRRHNPLVSQGKNKVVLPQIDLRKKSIEFSGATNEYKKIMVAKQVLLQTPSSMKHHQQA